MKFTIVAYPSKFSEIGFNYLLIRVSDGAIVGMIEECAVKDMQKILGMNTNTPLSGLSGTVTMRHGREQINIPFKEYSKE